MGTRTKFLLFGLGTILLFGFGVFTVKAEPGNNPVFATIQFVKDTISNALEPVNLKLEDHESRISDLEARVLALEQTTPPPSSCLNAPSGIVSWWTGDDTANDLKNVNNGTINSGVAYNDGKVGKAFSFNGTDGLLTAPTNSLPTGNADRTMEMWVKVNAFLADIPDPSSNQETYFGGYGVFGGSGTIYVVGTAGNVLYFSIYGPTLFGPSLEINKWYHLAVTYTGNVATLYLNGSVVKTGGMTINTPAGGQLNVGRVAGSMGDIRRLNGLVDEITIYNRALSLGEISSIFEAGIYGKCK